MATSPYDPRHEEMVRRLRKARLDAGFTQAGVAAELGLPQSVISRLEAGQRKVSAIELRDLSELFGTSMEKLVPESGWKKGRRRSG